MTTWILGDMGGHPDVYAQCLDQAGVVDFTVPDGDMVVQVGDIVRCAEGFARGNRQCLDISRRLLERNPSSFVQLAGNHEAGALGGARQPGWSVDEAVPRDVQETLQRWWDGGLLHLAVAVGDILVTHAGLTRGRWTDLERPSSACEAAALLDADRGRPLHLVEHPGALSGTPNPSAGVMWAEVVDELLVPWLDNDDLPFDQVHGHASPFDWRRGDWWPSVPDRLAQVTHVDARSRTTWTQLGEHGACSVDWRLPDHLATSVAWPLLRVSDTGVRSFG